MTYITSIVANTIIIQIDLFQERFSNCSIPVMFLENEFDKNLKFIYQDRNKI